MNTKSRLFSQVPEYQKEYALASELPYWDIDNETVILVDGSLVKAFELKGVAIEAMDALQINQLTQDLRSTLNSLPDGCELTLVSLVDSDYTGTIQNHGSYESDLRNVDWLTKARVESLKEQVASRLLLRTRLYMFIYSRHTHSPQNRALSFFQSPQSFVSITREAYVLAEKELKQTSMAVADSLSSAGIGNYPLGQDQIWKLLYAFYNPKRSLNNPAPGIATAHRTQEFNPAELQIAPELSLSTPREQLLFADLVCENDTLYYDGFFHRCVTLKTLPEYTHSALCYKLMDLPFPHMLSVHVRVPDQSKELETLRAKRRMAHSMASSQDGRATDLESEAKLGSTEELMRELINTDQNLFYFQMTLLLRAETREELDYQTKTTLTKLRELNGAEGIAETVSTLKVWKTILPMGSTTMVRPKRVKTDNLADFLPIYQPYQSASSSKPVCLFKNRSMGLVQYDPFDPQLPNYNALVTGSSGSGKSFVNNLVLLQYVSQKPLIFVIDIGGSYRKLCEFLGGQYIEIAPAQTGTTPKSINPFELPRGQSEPSAQKIKFLLALCESIFTDETKPHLPKLERSILEERIIELYSRTTGTPTFSDFSALLSSSSDKRLQEYSKMLFPWTGNRAYGQLLDASNNIDISNNVVVFDLKGLSTYPDLQAVMLLIITDFILGRVEGQKDVRKQIVMDECWELLKSPASQQFMEYSVRTLRKTGSGITFITQGLEEIVASPIGPAILSNTATKFVLLQRGDLDQIGKTLRFNEQEIALIASLRQSKGNYSEAFLVANDARTVIRVEPTPLEYWIATSDASDNELIEKRRATSSSLSLKEIIEGLATQYPHGVAGGRK